MYRIVKEHILDKELKMGVVDTLINLIENDKHVVALEADLGAASGFNKIEKNCPDNFIQCGISEANMVGVAAGLSHVGYKPYIHSFAPFITRRVYDQLYVSCGYSKSDINIYGSDPGFCAAQNGGTHTSFEDIGLMRLIPDSIICDGTDSVLMEWIIKEFNTIKGIKYVRGNRKKVYSIYEEGSTFKLGKANILKEGSDILIVSSGQLCYEALMCAKKLEALNYSVMVIDMFCLKPFDIAAIVEYARDKKLVVTFENHSIIGGLGSSVGEVLAENKINVNFTRVGVNDRFGEVGDVAYLQKVYGLDEKTLYNRIIEKLREL